MFRNLNQQRGIYYLFVALSAMCSLASCSWIQKERYALPFVNSAKGLENANVIQSVQVYSNDSDIKFIAVATIENGNFQIVGLTSTSQRIFTIKSQSNEVQFEKSEWLPETVSLNQLLALMQFVYWPENTINHVYSGDWLIRSQPGKKAIYHGSHKVVEAQFTSELANWDEKIELHHYFADMTIIITPIEVKVL